MYHFLRHLQIPLQSDRELTETHCTAANDKAPATRPASATNILNNIIVVENIKMIFRPFKKMAVYFPKEIKRKG